MLTVTSSMTLGNGHGYVNSDIKYDIRTAHGYANSDIVYVISDHTRYVNMISCTSLATARVC